MAHPAHPNYDTEFPPLPPGIPVSFRSEFEQAVHEVQMKLFGNGLITLGPFRPWEHPHDYQTGGSHPVDIGTRVGRYEIVDKLQTDLHGLHWLCQDSEATKKSRYVSLLIMKADVSDDNMDLRCDRMVRDGDIDGKGIAVPIEMFKIDGPNGSHRVLVYEPMASPVDTVAELRISREGEKSIRSMCLQAARALATLHSRQICHGHITPYKIYAEIEGINGRSQDEVVAQIGLPNLGELVHSRTWEPHDLSTAPKYVVGVMDWTRVKQGPIRLSHNKFLLRLGTAYNSANPPEVLTLQPQYSPPEYLLDGTVGPSSDTWALGCTIYQLRTGYHLFDSAKMHYSDQTLFEMCLILGEMPEPWWTRWENRGSYFEEDHFDENGRPVLTEEFVGAEESLRPIRETIQACFDDHVVRGEESDDPVLVETFTIDEAELLTDLLERIFKWNPEDRLSIAEIAEHPWFRF